MKLTNRFEQLSALTRRVNNEVFILEHIGKTRVHFATVSHFGKFVRIDLFKWIYDSIIWEFSNWDKDSICRVLNLFQKQSWSNPTDLDFFINWGAFCFFTYFLVNFFLLISFKCKWIKLCLCLLIKSIVNEIAVHVCAQQIRSHQWIERQFFELNNFLKFLIFFRTIL